MNETEHQNKLESRRCWVRVLVTYAAAIYVFFGGAALVAALWIDPIDAEKLNMAKETFMMVLPVATGVVTYWFASRKPKPHAAETGRDESA